MTRDYKNINRKKTVTSGRLQSLLTFATGLLVGLLVALIVYMKEHQTGLASLQQPELIIQNKNKPRPVPTEILAQDENRKKVPQPQYDFYQILPNMEVNVSEWEAKDQKTTEPLPDTSGVYILQVGSFEQYEAADEAKAHLALLGIKADIQRVVINGREVRYRVRVGPYKDQARLEEARKLLLSNNLDFVLLKLKVNDM
jgi:cell division protein FtsN